MGKLSTLFGNLGNSNISKAIKKQAASTATDSFIKRFSNISNDLIGEGKTNKLYSSGENMWDTLSNRKINPLNIEEMTQSDTRKALNDLYSRSIAKADEAGAKSKVSDIKKSLGNLDYNLLGSDQATKNNMRSIMSSLDEDFYKNINTDTAPLKSTLKGIQDSINNLQTKINTTVLPDNVKKLLKNTTGNNVSQSGVKNLSTSIDNTNNIKSNNFTMTDSSPVVSGINKYKSDIPNNDAGILAIRSKYESAPKFDGGSKTIVLPDGTQLSGRYKLVDEGATTPSHNYKTFAQSDGFPKTKNGTTVNDRDYSIDKNAQQTVASHAQNYDGRAFNDNGIVVSKDGIVLSGNDRTMSGELAAEKNTDGAYKQYLLSNAGSYGFIPEQVSSMSHPRVVFQLDDNLKYDTNTFSAFNQSSSKGKSVYSRAAEMNKRIDNNPKLIQPMANIMSKFDTADQLFGDTKASKELAQEMVNLGMYSQSEMPKIFNGKTLTGEGKDSAQALILGNLINEENLGYFSQNPNLAFKLMKTAPDLIQNKAFGDNFSLSKKLNDAIRTYARASQNGEDVSSFIKKGSLFDEDNITDPTTIKLAELLEQRGYKNFQNYIKQANIGLSPSASGMVDMFSGSVRSMDDILSDLNKTYTDIEPSSKELMTVDKNNSADKKLAEEYNLKLSQLDSLKKQESDINSKIQEAYNGATIDFTTLKKIKEGVANRMASIKSAGSGATAEDKALLPFYRQINKALDEDITNGLKGYVGSDAKMELASILGNIDPRLSKYYTDMNDADFSIANIRNELSPYMFADDVLSESRQGTSKSTLPNLQVGQNGKLLSVDLGTAGNTAKEKIARTIAGQSPETTSNLGKLLKGGAAIGLGGAALAQLMGGTANGKDIVNRSGITTQTQPQQQQDTSTQYINNLLQQYMLQSMGGESGYTEPQTIGGYTADDYKNAYVAALKDGNLTMAKQYANTLDMFDNNDDTDSNLDRIQKLLNIQKLMNSNSSTSTGDSKKQAAINTLQNLMSNYSAQGVIGGNITNFLNGITGGAYNPKTAAYESGAQGSLAQIVKAMGDTGALSDRDLERAYNLIPKTTDSASAAQYKYQSLMNLLSNAEANNSLVVWN